VKRAIWWIRRDLRLTDNQTLNAALEESEDVLPVFVLDPKLLGSSYVGEKRLAFLLDGLRVLDEALRLRGSYLIVRKGNPLDELVNLTQTSGSEIIYAEPDYSPYARQRDQKVAMHLPINWIGDPAFHPPGTVLKSNGGPYSVFTPFSKAWKALPTLKFQRVVKTPEAIHTPDEIETILIPEKPTLPSSVPFQAGEEEAQRRLEYFVNTPINEEHQIVSSLALKRIENYAQLRNRLDLEGTSNLSPYLRFGMISIRQAVAFAYKAIQSTMDVVARNSTETWLNELIWRDFYIHVLYHFPQVRKHNFRMRHVRWLNKEEDFVAWCQGRTGYPVVDAGMRQLLMSGWMHNRVRMITASFLTKDLLIDWKWGERWFMQHLVDGDPAANNGGWQWTAGTGTDAAPYFRIFNPITQSIKFDPQGMYIRRWLPELASVTLEFIHQPWVMDDEQQISSSCVIGKDYPSPIVDHAFARDRALCAYRK